MKKSKQFLFLGAIFLVIVLGIFFYFFKGNFFLKQELIEIKPQLDFQENSALNLFGTKDSYIKELCYLYEEPVEITGIGSAKVNREYVKLTIVDGEKVSGLHGIIPFENTHNKATLMGVTNGEFINTVATVTYENQTWQEQRVYKRGEGKLYVGYDLLNEPRIQNEQGVFMYPNDNIQDLGFETEEFYLDLVDCTTLRAKFALQE